MQGSASAAAAAATSGLADEDEDNEDDDGWEDDPGDTLDLSLGSTKADLMGWAEGSRQRDDETQAYLADFFIRAARENIAGFQNWFGMLTEEEKQKLHELAAQ